jgi:hypothetical protein
MQIRFELTTPYGIIYSEIMDVNDEQLVTIRDKSKNFYETGFEMYTDDGFVIIPPEVTRTSVLKIKIEENGNQEQV